MKKVTVPFFIVHQGCPHRCVFCNQEKIAGTFHHLPTAGEMADKVAHWHTSSGNAAMEVAFFGGSFTALPHHEQHRLLVSLQPSCMPAWSVPSGFPPVPMQ